jgi:cytochrome b involved in lipid metabolism
MITKWLKRKKKKPKIPRDFTRKEVSEHCKENDCYIIKNKKVYDVTEFLEHHPAGKEIILEYAGKDITEPYNLNHHFIDINSLLSEYYMGNVID